MLSRYVTSISFAVKEKLERCSLFHSGQGFTSYTSSTFPIGLVGSEVNGPSGEGSLLKNPTAAVDFASVDIATEVIDGSTNVVRQTALDVVHGDSLSLRPRFQKSIICAGGARCGNDAIGRAENFLHALRLVTPIVFVVLDDAERVNPEILMAETARDLDCIPKGPRKGVDRDGPLLPAIDIGSESLQALVMRSSPHVREGDVLGTPPAEFSCPADEPNSR